jgi:hypothetical protein
MERRGTQHAAYESPMAVEVGGFSELTRIRRISDLLDNAVGDSLSDWPEEF